MEARIQFRVSEETKRLAQLYADKQGTTLSDECRQLAEQMAAAQRQQSNHEEWLEEQIELAFKKLEQGQAVFIEHEEAKARMKERKEAIRKKKALSYT